MDICPYQLANKFLNVKFEMSGYSKTTNIASFDKSICLYLNVKIWAKSNVKNKFYIFRNFFKHVAGTKN